MINTISNFNLALFDTLPNPGQGAATPEAEKGDFASLLLGIPVTSVPVNTADPASSAVVPSPVPVLSGEMSAKADEGSPATTSAVAVIPRPGAAPASEIPMQEDLCWGVMGCELPANDAGLQVLKAKRYIFDIEAPIENQPIKMPVQPGGGKDFPLSVLTPRRVITNIEAPIKIPSQQGIDTSTIDKEYPIDALIRQRPIIEAATPISTGMVPNTGIDQKRPIDVLGRQRPVIEVASPISTGMVPNTGIDQKHPIDVLGRQRPVIAAASPISTGIVPHTDTVADPRISAFDAPEIAGNPSTPADPAWQSDLDGKPIKPQAPSVPVLPTRLPPQGSLWSNENVRDPKGKKEGSGIAVLTNRRPITDHPLQNAEMTAPASATPTGTSIIEKARASVSQDVVITDVEVSSPLPVFETGPPVTPEVRLVSDAEAVSDVLVAESKVAAAIESREGVKPKDTLEFQPTIRPGVPPLRSQRPLERNPFETGETAETPGTTETVETSERIETVVSPAGGVTENISGLRQLRREVSIAYEPVPEGSPRTLRSYTVRNATSQIYGQTPIELIENPTDGEPVQGEIDVQAHDRMDIFNNVIDKFKATDATPVNDVTTETVAELLKQAKETVDQLKPGLIELAALTARKNEKQSMRMRLHPAELGTVDISLERNSNGSLNAHFNTGNDNAREVLTQNIDQLRESLQNAGWQVGQLQVSSGSSPFTSANGQGDRRPQSESFQGHMSGSNTEQSEEAEQDSSRLLNLRA